MTRNKIYYTRPNADGSGMTVSCHTETESDKVAIAAIEEKAAGIRGDQVVIRSVDGVVTEVKRGLAK